MPKILVTLAVLAAAAFFSLPSSANAAQSKRGAETDRSATMPTDISAHRRRYYRGYGPYSYDGFTPGWGYARPYHYYSYYGPAYAFSYTYPYRSGYWGGPNIFPYGPWW
jgi:hypothetical protein